jgi:serine/threonine protein kinase
MPSLKTQRRVRSLNRGNKINKLRKTKRRSKSAEPYSNINAEKIGEGGFGIVSRPPARCGHFFSENSKNINERNVNSTVFQETYYKNPNYISKLGEWDQSKKEKDIGNIIKKNIKNWRNYYCFIEFICGAPKEKHIRVGIDDYQDTYGIAPYCGVTLNNLLKEKYYINPKEVCCLMESLKQVVLGLGDLHHIQIYHQDIHADNILFNPKDKKFRWIDFGLAQDLYDEKMKDKNNWEVNPIIVTAKHFDTENLIFDIIKPTLEFILYKLQELKTNGKNLNKTTQDCYDDVIYYLYKIPNKVGEHSLPNKYDNFKKYFKEFLEVKNKYVAFVEDFVENYDENKRCKFSKINK